MSSLQQLIYDEFPGATASSYHEDLHDQVREKMMTLSVMMDLDVSGVKLNLMKLFTLNS